MSLKNHTGSIIENVGDPTLKTILKFVNMPVSYQSEEGLKVVLYLHLIILQKRMLLKT